MKGGGGKAGEFPEVGNHVGLVIIAQLQSGRGPLQRLRLTGAFDEVLKSNHAGKEFGADAHMLFKPASEVLAADADRGADLLNRNRTL